MVRAGLGVVFSFLTLLLQMLRGSRFFFSESCSRQTQCGTITRASSPRGKTKNVKSAFADCIFGAGKLNGENEKCVWKGGNEQKLRTQIRFCVSKNLKSTYSVNFSVTQYADISDFTSELWKLVMVTDRFHLNEIFSLILERLLKNNQHMKPIPEKKPRTRWKSSSSFRLHFH